MIEWTGVDGVDGVDKLAGSGNSLWGERLTTQVRVCRKILEFSAIKGVGGSPGFLFGSFFFEVLALVSVGLASADPDLDLDSMVFPVEAEGDKSLAFYRAGFKELDDFCLMQQQLARALSVVLLMAGTFVRLDVCVVKECFLVFDPGEGVTQVGQAGADRFYLGTGETDTGFDLLQDLKVMKCSPI
jgi:hypothetical protein